MEKALLLLLFLQTSEAVDRSVSLIAFHTEHQLLQFLNHIDNPDRDLHLFAHPALTPNALTRGGPAGACASKCLSIVQTEVRLSLRWPGEVYAGIAEPGHQLDVV